jgi:hypothetical protein
VEIVVRREQDPQALDAVGCHHDVYIRRFAPSTLFAKVKQRPRGVIDSYMSLSVTVVSFMVPVGGEWGHDMGARYII